MKKFTDKFSNTLFGGLDRGSVCMMMILCIVALAGHFLGWRMQSEDVPLLMGISVLTQGNTLADVLKWEQDDMHSREVVTVLAGQNLTVNAVLGKITKSTPATGTADAGNTGGGTCASVAAGALAKIGTYTITCLTFVASPLAATFEVKDPDGNLLPDASLAAYANAQINFTMANGSPAITVGDKWTIAVAAGSGSVRAIDFSGVDGSQDAYGILTADVDATSGALSGVAVVRDADIVAANLVWPVTSPVVSAAQKAAALAQLLEKGIVERTEA